jgi:hypothetical protein
MAFTFPSSSLENSHLLWRPSSLVRMASMGLFLSRKNIPCFLNSPVSSFVGAEIIGP